MERQDQITEAYKDVAEYVKKHINSEGWVPHRYLLELLPIYCFDDIDKINREFVRPKILRQ